MVKQIAIYLIAVNIISMIFPGKTYEKYLNFFVYLILVIMIIEPFLVFFKINNYKEFFNANISFKDAIENNITYQNIDEDISNQKLAAYKDELENELEKYLEIEGDVNNNVNCEIEISEDEIQLNEIKINFDYEYEIDNNIRLLQEEDIKNKIDALFGQEVNISFMY